jgi:hypothetical protein
MVVITLNMTLFLLALLWPVTVRSTCITLLWLTMAAFLYKTREWAAGHEVTTVGHGLLFPLV